MVIIRRWRPDLLEVAAPVRSWPRRCCAPGPTPAASTPRQRSRCSPAWHPPANSRQVTTRSRLNRFGNRQLNRALHAVVRVRVQYQPATGDHTYSAIALAAVFALAAEHTDDAIVRRDGQSRAMELLLAMEAAGQLNSALNKGRLRKATDLNGLRDLPEFEELKRRVVGDESPVQP